MAKKIVKKAVKPSVQSEHAQIVGFVLLMVVRLFSAVLVAIAVITATLVPFNNGDILMCATLLALSFMACALVQICYDL